ncbi:MAG TPA: hypothetical protein VKR06_27245 [Ktedonosporobacter sp.]|nr:hypothetical protein [Ktedonosporobacter sp.]
MQMAVANQSTWLGPSGFASWLEQQKAQKVPPRLDVVMFGHVRDDNDLPRLFPWASHLTSEEQRELLGSLKPMFCEIIPCTAMTVGILIPPMDGPELLATASFLQAQQLLEEALDFVAEYKTRIVCLAGLNGALSFYGQSVMEKAQKLGIALTTGHAMTTTCVFRTYQRAVQDLALDPSEDRMSIVGLGSIGASFARLLLRQRQRPRELVLVDQPNRRQRIEQLAEEFRSSSDVKISLEFTTPEGHLLPDSACYHSRYLISAISSSNAIDIDGLASGTVLVDDSQPHAWSRSQAWKRCSERQDIVPCDTGIVDSRCIGYYSYFPFDFTENDANGSSLSWSCFTEGLMKMLDDDLPSTIGEPLIENVLRYHRAFDRFGFAIPALRCGPRLIPVEQIRGEFHRFS